MLKKQLKTTIYELAIWVRIDMKLQLVRNEYKVVIVASPLTIAHKVYEVDFERLSNGYSNIDVEKNIHECVHIHFQLDEPHVDIET